MSGQGIAIGIDSYSYHRYFGENTAWEKPRETRWSVFDFLRRARDLGVTGVSLQTCYLPPLTDAFAGALRDELRALGLQPVLAWGHPAGLEGGDKPDKVEEFSRLLPVAKAVGCSLVRLVCGNHFTWKVPVGERTERLTPILRRFNDEAKELGLSLAVENHADFPMRDLVALVKSVGDPNIGICLDTGNAVRVGDDLMDAARLAAPHVKMVHLKDMIVIAASRGEPTAWWPAAPLGRGHFDIPGLIGILRKGGFAGTLFVEMPNTYPDWPDEDAAVAESVGYLRGLLKKKPPGRRPK